MERFIKIGLGLGFLWLGVLRGAKGLIVRVKNYTFNSINTDGTISLNLNLLIKNPLLVGVIIKSVIGEVYAQGFKIGDVNTSYNYYIAGGRTHILPVVVNLNFSSISQALLLNIQSGDIKTLTVAFNGELIAGKYNIPIPLQFEMDYNDLTKG